MQISYIMHCQNINNNIGTTSLKHIINYIGEQEMVIFDLFIAVFHFSDHYLYKTEHCVFQELF